MTDQLPLVLMQNAKNSALDQFDAYIAASLFVEECDKRGWTLERVAQALGDFGAWRREIEHACFEALLRGGHTSGQHVVNGCSFCDEDEKETTNE